jgi:hypothetical protein
MKSKLLLFAFIMFSASSFAQEKKTLDNLGNANSNQASFSFDSEEFNFGTIKQGESVTHEFKFTNNGNEPLIITSAEGSCGCTVPTYPKQPIMKGQSGVIKVTFDSSGKLGIMDKTVTLSSNATPNPVILHVKGTIEKPVDPQSSGTDKN